MIDLHIHSVYSDGTCTIDEIIDIAKELNLSQIAITDHNNLEGSIAAHERTDIDSAIGIEITTEYEKAEIHLLGYFLNGSKSNYESVRFILKEAEARKRIATVETIENLNAAGIDISVNELKEFTRGTINRVHICKAMMKHGYINSVNEGFAKYVGDDCPAYVEAERVSLAEATEAIHSDGGIAVIAHPYEYVDSLNIWDFLDANIDMVDGIECFHPSATSEQSKMLVKYANKHSKIITGGSDFHGDNKPDVLLGMMNVDDKYRI